MFGHLSLAEILILTSVSGVPIVIGWFLVRAWDRRNTAAQELDELTLELAALSDQNDLLADELADLASEAKMASRLSGSAPPAPDPATLDQSRAT